MAFLGLLDINHLWTLSFCASFVDTASTVNIWTYSLVDSVYPTKIFFMTAGAVLRISGNKRRYVWPFWVFRYGPNWAKNNHLTPVWSLIQMYLFLSRPFWFFFQKKIYFISMQKSSLLRYHLFLQYGSFRILEKTSSKVMCTWLYLHNFLSEFTMANFQF